MSQAPFTEDFSNTIYLDNAATVFPKPPEVLEQMIEFYRSYGVNAGRSGHDLAKYAGQFVDETRRKLTRLFGGDDPNRLVFCNNCTDALNILLNGLLEAGDHVITTTLEHNSVIRPLNHLRKKHNVDVSYVPFQESGFVDPERIASHIKTNTKLVLVNHGSNVIGTIQPVSDIGRICREQDICFAIDSAQTAGVIPINMAEMNIDAVAFTGHKGLLGPTGIGGLCLSDRINIEPTRVGGTGVRSSEPLQPAVYPYLLEAGTLNILGIAGLHFALQYLEKQGMKNIYQQEMELFSGLQNGLLNIDGVLMFGPTTLDNRLPVLNFCLEGIDTSTVGIVLDVDFNIAARTGLHCAPLLHEQLETSLFGSVRLSLGHANTSDEIDAVLEAVKEIANG